MRRRELVAGVGSLGVLGGSGALLWRGPPSFGDGDDAETPDDEGSDGPLEVETIDARGSEAGTMAVPSDGVTVAMFFVTGCGNCQAQMPRLAEARGALREEYGDAVTFLSVTYQSFDHMPADELRDWWERHGGNWYVGYDSNSGLSRSYGVVGYPVTVVIDPDGEKRWHETGVASADAIVAAAEPVLEEVAESEAAVESDDGDDDTTGDDGEDGGGSGESAGNESEE